MTDKAEESFDWADPAKVLAKMGPELEEPNPEAEVPPKVEEKTAEVPAKEPELKPTEEPGGVLAKDGKTVIPYHVLAEERRLRKEAQDKLDEFERLVQEAESGDTATLPDLAKLEAEYAEQPELLASIKALYAKVGVLDQSNRKLTKQVEDEQKAKQVQEQELAAGQYFQDLQVAPMLLKLERDKGPLYEQAKAISDRLLQDETHMATVTQSGKADLSTARKAHNKVVEAELKGLLGIAAAAEPPPKSETKPAAQPKALPVVETKPPESISEIPGGVAPAASEAEGFQNMDPMKSAAFLMKMTPAQQDEWLARNYR